MSCAFRKPVAVPAQWLARSRTWAVQLAAHFAAGGSPGSLARSGGRGTERNIDRLMQGKIGECALALYLELDPEHAVQWPIRADDGTDVVTPLGIRIDVKTTFPRYRLIWSNSVNDLYELKRFDALVAVSMLQENCGCCWIEGYVTKQDFFDRKRIANGSNGLEPGTWYMEKAELADIDELLEPTLPDLNEMLTRYHSSPAIWAEWDRRHVICELVAGRSP